MGPKIRQVQHLFLQRVLKSDIGSNKRNLYFVPIKGAHFLRESIASETLQNTEYTTNIMALHSEDNILVKKATSVESITGSSTYL